MAQGADHQIVEDEPQIGFAGAEVGDDGIRLLGQQAVEQRTQQLHQMQDLLEFAPRIAIERAIAGQDVQRLQECDGIGLRLAGPDLGQGLLRLEIIGALSRHD